ncbi:MAG: hypothetical protein NTW69_02075 [Chloroflexi bacterium]|nr:hypothetical protein [Chloroflexota bacterium]
MSSSRLGWSGLAAVLKMYWYLPALPEAGVNRFTRLQAEIAATTEKKKISLRIFMVGLLAYS